MKLARIAKVYNADVDAYAINRNTAFRMINIVVDPKLTRP